MRLVVFLVLVLPMLAGLAYLSVLEIRTDRTHWYDLCQQQFSGAQCRVINHD